MLKKINWSQWYYLILVIVLMGMLVLKMVDTYKTNEALFDLMDYYDEQQDLNYELLELIIEQKKVIVQYQYILEEFAAE